MKQSSTAGCITTLLLRAQTRDRERVHFAPTGDCDTVTPFDNVPASLVRRSNQFNVDCYGNDTPVLYRSHKPIIRSSASTFSLGGRSSVSVRFVEQPPVCRIGAANVDPACTQNADLLSSNFERSFDAALLDTVEVEADPPQPQPQPQQQTSSSKDEKENSDSSSVDQLSERSRLRLELPVQLSKMALSTMNGNGLSVQSQSQAHFGFGMNNGATCVNCGRGFEPDEPTTNVNGSFWHAACFTASSNVPVCEHCYEVVNEGPDDRIVAYQGRYWHSRCFVCAQCFRSFKDGVFYEFDGRKYCEDDFNMLFAPCCKRCDAFITGRVIKAMNCNWHPACFCCEECSRCLADEGFVKNAGRALCKDCNLNVKSSAKVRHICFRCRAEVDDSALLRYKGEVYHAYHFKCHSCSVECNADAREKEGELFCLRCYDKMGVKICAACRRPIDERVVNAMGKTWHVEHFVCAKCEKPFLGSQHHEKKGQAYCTTHYLMLFGNVCFYCEQVISSEVVAALSKNWCPEHFSCSVCDKKLGPKSKFYDFDLKPVCKTCYDKFPSELQKRLKKMADKK